MAQRLFDWQLDRLLLECYHMVSVWGRSVAHGWFWSSTLLQFHTHRHTHTHIYLTHIILSCIIKKTPRNGVRMIRVMPYAWCLGWCLYLGEACICVRLCKCAHSFSLCVLVCLSDRTVGDVLSSWTNFWHPTILLFEKEPLFSQSLPSTTHTDS